ncbi:hypothetical protein OROMI_029514 [Orobanche minor]
MKEFKSSTGFQSGPLGPPPDSRGDTEIKWVSEDSKRRNNRATTNSPKRDLPELPKSSRHQSDNNIISNDSPRKQKSRQSRRQQGKDSSNKSGHQPDSLPDIPRKSRRNKSKESDGGCGGSTRLRSKCTTSNDTEIVYSDTGTMLPKPRSRLSLIPKLDDQDNRNSAISKD